MRWVRALSQSSHSSVLAAGLGMIAAIGLLDFLTGPELSLSIFYLLPVAMLAWFGGMSVGIGASVVSALAWLVADLLGGNQYSHPAIPYWNSIVRLGVFAVVAVTLGFLRRSEGRKEELLSFIVHDLRSPLSSVILGLEVLQRASNSDTDGKHGDFVDLCMASCRRMLTLTEAMLDLSRLEAGRMALHIQDADVQKLVEESIDQVALWARNKDVRLQTSVGSGELRLKADAELTVRVLVNLLSNAVKFTPPSSTVSVDVQEANGDVVFTVTDEGEGVPKEWAERVFDKYVQVDARRRGASVGTGLGLAFAREAVQAQGGRIWIDTGRERGTAVRFRLPAGRSNGGFPPESADRGPGSSKH